MAQKLAIRYTDRGGAVQVQPYRLDDGALLPFGNPFVPTGGLPADGNPRAKTNLIVKFGPEFYCAVSASIHRYNPLTNNWDFDVNDRDVSPLTDFGGLYVLRGTAGTPVLVSVNRTLAGNIRVWTLDQPGGTWSFVDGTATSGLAVDGFDLGHQWRNQLHTIVDDVIVIVDGDSGVVTTQTGLIAHNSYGSFWIRADGRLFLVAVPAPTPVAFAVVYEYDAGVYTLVVPGAAPMPVLDAAGAPATTARWLAGHYDEPSDSIIVHAYESSAGGNGWRVIQIPLTTLTPSDITGSQTELPPSALAFPTGPDPTDGTFDDVAWTMNLDNETDPLNPVQFMLLRVADGPWERFRWNGVGADMNTLGFGGDRGVAPTNDPNGGGEYSYDGSTTAFPYFGIMEVAPRQEIQGGTRLFVTGYLFDETGGSPSPVDKTVAVYYAASGENSPKLLATLQNPALVSGPGSSPSLAGGKIASFSMDGLSVYSVEWLGSSSDGVPNTQDHQLMIVAEV